MKKQSAVVVAAVLCVGMGVAALSSRGSHPALSVQERDAAYRDGAYQAHLDVDRGRKAHFSSGRWSTDQDRASFIAGYEQSFRTLSEARTGKPASSNAAELAAYRDGVADGARHRRSSQPFQLNKTDNYRRIETDAGNRDAYSNGYQEGYYLPQESAELRTLSQK